MDSLDSAIDDSCLSKFSKKNLKKFFKLAKNSAEASDWKKQHLGSVITYKNKVLTFGWNTTAESPMQKSFNKYRKCFDPDTERNSAHAEINAICKLLRCYNIKSFEKNKLSIFIFREHKNKNLALAKPCPACEEALKQIGIKNVFYTGNNSIIFERYL